jgi:hypothetical protein
MAWLTIEFHPGFAEDLTSWRTEIHRDGSLSQVVQVNRFSPREQRTTRHDVTLSPERVAELERLVDATDFAALTAASRGFTVDDAEHISIRIEGSPERVIGAPLLLWQYLASRDEAPACPALEDAIRLWQAIERASPHKLSD